MTHACTMWETPFLWGTYVGNKNSRRQTHNIYGTTLLARCGTPRALAATKNIQKGTHTQRSQHHHIARDRAPHTLAARKKHPRRHTHTQHSRHRTSCMRWVTLMPLPLQKQPTKLKRNAHDTTFLAWQGARRAVPTPKIPPKKAEKNVQPQKPPHRKKQPTCPGGRVGCFFCGHRLDYNERSSRL